MAAIVLPFNFQGLVASQEFATLSYFCVRVLFTAPCILIAEICIINTDLRPVHMGKVILVSEKTFRQVCKRDLTLLYLGTQESVFPI